MCHNINSYKIFQNTLWIARDIIIMLLIWKWSHLHEFKPKNCVWKNTNYMLSNHEIWYFYVILYLYFVRKILTFICQRIVEARFFGPQQTKSNTPVICQGSKAHQAQWSTVAKTWKEMAKSHQPSPSPKEINRSPAHSIPNFRFATAAPREFKIIQKGEGKWLSRKTPFFPPLLVWCSRCWKEIFPRQRSDFQSHHNHSKRLVFFINQQIRNMVPGKMVCGSTNQKQEKMKEAGPPHRPVVHSELPSGPQQTLLQDDLRRHQL